MSSVTESELEKQLISAIAETSRAIKKLEEERSALERQLLRVRGTNVNLNDVNRRDSINRAIAESAVLDALYQAQKPLALDKLYGAVLVKNADAKLATIRTYLSRMKQKGLIENAGRGRWQLPSG